MVLPAAAVAAVGGEHAGHLGIEVAAAATGVGLQRGRGLQLSHREQSEGRITGQIPRCHKLSPSVGCSSGHRHGANTHQAAAEHALQEAHDRLAVLAAAAGALQARQAVVQGVDRVGVGHQALAAAEGRGDAIAGRVEGGHAGRVAAVRAGVAAAVGGDTVVVAPRPETGVQRAAAGGVQRPRGAHAGEWVCRVDAAQLLQAPTLGLPTRALVLTQMPGMPRCRCSLVSCQRGLVYSIQ